MASVYEATQLDLQRRVALKLLADEQDAIPSIEREARAAAQLAHPHIVQVTEIVKPDDGPPFLVMELLDGESLDERIARMGPLAPDRSAFIAVQVLSALASAHASGIIHRDVKPANVFLTRTAATNDFVKLLDFGIARRVSGVVSSKSGRRGGTPAYMAPEQIVADVEIDARTDVWAVGVCLYEMIAGVPPFSGPNIPSLLVKICEATAPELDTNRGLAAVIARAMAKDPKERFESAEEMRRALLPIARADTVPSAHAGPLPPLSPERQEAPTMTAPPAPRILDAEPSRETKRSGATMPSAPPPRAMAPSHRGFAVGIAGAGIVLAVAVGISGPTRHEVASPHAIASAAPSAKPSRSACVLGTPLAPWLIGRRRVSISAKRDEVLLATNADSDMDLPRFASATAGEEKLEEWKLPPFIVNAEFAHWSSDAAVSDTDVVAVVVRVDRSPGKEPATKYMLFNNKRHRSDAPTFARAHADDEDTENARAAVVGFATFVVAVGVGLLPGANRPFPHTRIARRGGAAEGMALFPGFERPDDMALAAGPDRVAVALTFADKIEVATYEAMNLQALPPRMAYGKPRNARVAVLYGDALVVWRDADARELRHMVVRGPDLMQDGTLARGDFVAHAVAATNDQALLAFAQKSDEGTILYAGSGERLKDAALTMSPVRVVRERPVTQLLLAGGSRPWLAWTEATGDETAEAHVAPLDCP